MFYGLFRHAVDAKGRVALPAQFRRDLAGAVIAPGSERRLVIRPTAEWETYEKNFRMTASTRAAERRFIRHAYAGARPIDIDAQGRILLTAEHRDFARITDRAVFVGVSNVVEIVGEAIWDAESAELDPQTFTELGDSLLRSPLAAGEPDA